METLARLAIGTALVGVILGILATIPAIPAEYLNMVAQFVGFLQPAFGVVDFFCDWAIVSKSLIIFMSIFLICRAAMLINWIYSFFT